MTSEYAKRILLGFLFPSVKSGTLILRPLMLYNVPPPPPPPLGDSKLGLVKIDFIIYLNSFLELASKSMLQIFCEMQTNKRSVFDFGAFVAAPIHSYIIIIVIIREFLSC